MLALGAFVHHSRTLSGSLVESVLQCGHKARSGRLPLACSGNMYQPRCTHLSAVSSKLGEPPGMVYPSPGQSEDQPQASKGLYTADLEEVPAIERKADHPMTKETGVTPA